MSCKISLHNWPTTRIQGGDRKAEVLSVWYLALHTCPLDPQNSLRVHSLSPLHTCRRQQAFIRSQRLVGTTAVHRQRLVAYHVLLTFQPQRKW